MKVLIADDHPLAREGARQALLADEGFEVVGEAAEGTEVLPLVARTRPDAVLMDLRMPGLDGLACLDELRVRYPEVKVVILSALDDSAQILGALRRGASGYVLKTINPVDLPSAVRQAVDACVFIVLAEGEAGDGPDALTERELRILRSVARGLSNRAIARELWVTEQTVKFHLTKMYRKLGVANRTEAARYAYERGLDGDQS